MATIASGGASVWVLYEEVDGNVVVKAMAVTAFLYDNVAQVQNMLIYSLSHYENVSRELWMEGMRGFQTYAKENNCGAVIAYTKVSGVARLAKSLNADIDTTLITWRL